MALKMSNEFKNTKIEECNEPNEGTFERKRGLKSKVTMPAV